MRRLILLILPMLLFFSSVRGEETPTFYEAPKQIVITFTGDCTLGIDDRERGLDTSFNAYIEKNGMDYPFEKVRDIFLQDDLTVINLEGTFYNYAGNRTQNTYAFRGPTEYADILTRAGIEACSLGNNHIMDYDLPGLKSTTETLENKGVAWFGVNEYINQYYVFEKDGIRIGFVSMYSSDWWRNPAQLRICYENLEKENCDLIIGCLHGGNEYFTRFDEGGGQEQLANKMIALGATIVVGNHPHTVQGIRVEDGCTTLWSLGNFVFGGNSRIKLNKLDEPSVACYLAQFTLSFDENNVYLGHQLNIIPCFVSSSTERNYYQPYPVAGADAEFVMRAIYRDRTPKNLTLYPFVEGVGALQAFVPAPRR